MYGTTLILTLGMLSQVSPLPATTDTSTTGTTVAPVVNVGTSAATSGAAELIDGLLNLPTDAKVAGRPVSLLDVLGQVSDRSRQVQIAGAYWKTIAGIADYHAAWQQQNRYEQLLPLVAARRDAEGQLELETRLMTSRAETEEARLWIATAQYELAEKAGLSVSGGLPLPTDRPHVGTYTTYYSSIFAGRAAPLELQRIESSLVLEREAIEAHAKAVQAAVDAFDGAREAFSHGTLGWRSLASSLERVCTAERGLGMAVLRYNADIASYALSVAPPEIQGAGLVGMLIKTPATTTAAATAPVATIDPNVSRATFDERSATPTANQPTLAPPRAAPTPAPGATNHTGVIPLRSLGPDEGPRTARREPFADIQAPIAEVAGGALYGGLVPLSPARRAQELAETLHWNRTKLDESTATLSLAEALGKAGTDRRGIIHSYWNVCQATAQYQALLQHVEQLDALQPLLVAARSQPGASDAMLRFEAVRTSARAAVIDARVTMLEERSKLAQRLGLPAGTTPPMPSTSPHGGDYSVRDAADNPTLSRSARAIPTLHKSLELRASAAILSDSAHTAATSALAANVARTDEALATIERATADTLAFLDLLTQYNQEIADYTLERLGPAAAPADIVKSLVLQ